MAQQTYGEWMRSNPPILTLTAVEWLVNELANTGLLVTKDVDNLVAYHKAKQMEKEQMIKSNRDGVDMCVHSYILTSEEGHRVIKCTICNSIQPI